jgi:hypothetical protein
MKPVETPDTNFTYKLPGGTSENDLPCERGTVSGNPFVRSTWNFDEDEADLFRSTEGALFIMVYSRDTEIAVYPRGERMRPLPLNVVSDDGDGKLYMVGAAGTQREAILEDGVIDLMVFEVPTPPVALWVQSFAEVAPAMGEPVLDRKRWMVVLDSPPEYDLPMLRPAIEAALRHSVDVQVLDMELLPPSVVSDDPEGLDHPDTKGA